MLQILRRFFRRPVNQEKAQAKLLEKERKKAEGKMGTLRALLKRQPALLYNDLAYEVYGCSDMLSVYAKPSRISVKDRIERLQRLNDEIKHLEQLLRKHQLSVFAHAAQEWTYYRINREQKRERARRQKAANNDLLSYH
uniref:BHLH domain-containing protein n=1 Tax=Caenorhabditis tropicalis TaxID=1561998 RepID=A0A1I7U164_9PELO